MDSDTPSAAAVVLDPEDPSKLLIDPLLARALGLVGPRTPRAVAPLDADVLAATVADRVVERLAEQRRAPTQEPRPARKPSMAPAGPDVGPASVSAGGPPSDLSATQKFMKIAAYATRTGYSTRTIETFIGEGLPTVGERRLRRVDVEPADEWIRTQAPRERDAQDAIIDEARKDARRARAGSTRRRP
jgi:hypothetical protein